jgi:4-hydroxy-tetrahydrodipicolinate synthase
MNTPLFTGVCTALVTPFLDDKINYPMVQQLLRRQTEAGVQAVVISGTTGESPTLTDEEKRTLFRRCKEYVQDRCLIIAGTGSNSTEHAVALSLEAEAAGADALLVVSPYYNKATPDGLIAHFVTIAHAVTIPVIIYNVPSRTGVDIPVSVYTRLSNVANIAGVKEASGDITKIIQIKSECPSHFSVWTGNDDQIVPALSAGAQGVISVLSNLLPEQTLAMANAAFSGDFRTAAAIQQRLQPLIRLLFAEVNPIPVKEAMKITGYDCGGYRLPLTPPSKELREKLIHYLK